MKLIEGRKFCTTMAKVVRILGSGPWCLIGGRAVEVYTNPPQSPDIDILISAADYDVPKLIKKFKSENIVLREEYEEGYIAFMDDKDNGEEVDVMPTYDQFEVSAIGLAKKTRCGKAMFPVISIEDLVILKAIAASSEGGMMGRSDEKKQHDARAIYILNKENKLDREYIRKVLKKESLARETKLLTRLKVI